MTFLKQAATLSKHKYWLLITLNQHWTDDSVMSSQLKLAWVQSETLPSKFFYLTLFTRIGSKLLHSSALLLLPYHSIKTEILQWHITDAGLTMSLYSWFHFSEHWRNCHWMSAGYIKGQKHVSSCTVAPTKGRQCRTSNVSDQILWYKYQRATATQSLTIDSFSQIVGLTINNIIQTNQHPTAIEVGQS